MPSFTQPRAPRPADPKVPDFALLNIAPDKVGFIIVKARAVDVKESDSDPDSGSNATDDGMADVLEDTPDDATRGELIAFLRSLNEDELFSVIALAWIGRGTYDASEWRDAIAMARQEHGRRAAEYLLGLPMLGDYLEEGLAVFGDTYAD